MNTFQRGRVERLVRVLQGYGGPIHMRGNEKRYELIPGNGSVWIKKFMDGSGYRVTSTDIHAGHKLCRACLGEEHGNTVFGYPTWKMS